MATQHCFLAAALFLAGTAVNLGQLRLASEAASADQPTTGATASQMHFGAWGFDVTGLDAKAKPSDSFYEYANGLWDARTTIPLDRSRFGLFDLLTDRTQEQLRAVIEDAAKSLGGNAFISLA